MSITLDDVSCLLHIPIRGKLLDHFRLSRDEVVEMMVTYLLVDPSDDQKEVVNTIDAHAKFRFLEYLYKDHL